jgi:hypothetical protein
VCTPISCVSINACPTKEKPICQKQSDAKVAFVCIAGRQRETKVIVVGATFDEVKLAVNRAVEQKGWTLGEIREVNGKFEVVVKTNEQADASNEKTLNDEVKASLEAESLVVADEAVVDDPDTDDASRAAAVTLLTFAVALVAST